MILLSKHPSYFIGKWYTLLQFEVKRFLKLKFVVTFCDYFHTFVLDFVKYFQDFSLNFVIYV